MKAASAPATPPKQRMIEAAGKLFAERGFDAVSIRDITTAAKANVAAINYHFGSRDALVSTVISHIITPIHDERLLRLDQSEATHGRHPLPLELIVDAFARPLTSHSRRSGLSEPTYLKLLGRSLAQPVASLQPALGTQAITLFNRFLHALAKALPGVPADELAWRLHFVSGAMNHMLSHAVDLHQLTAGTSGKPATDALLSRFIRFAKAGLSEGHKEGVPAPLKDAPEIPTPEPKDPNQGLLFDF